MVLGFDEKRPSENEYHELINSFSKGLKELDKDISLMGYGSYSRGSSYYGSSDIDALLILPNSSSALLDDVATIYSASKRSSVPFQLSVSNRKTMSDARLNSFYSSYEKYFLSEGIFYVGPDIRDSFSYMAFKSGSQSTVSHQLRKLRTKFLTRKSKDYPNYVVDFNSCLDGVSNFVRTLSETISDTCVSERFDSVGFLDELNIDSSFYFDLKDLTRKNTSRLDKLFFNKDQMDMYWFRSIDYLESIISSYIDKFPLDDDSIFKLSHNFS
jgi:hypothetical protein